jgi:hypothetical protein
MNYLCCTYSLKIYQICCLGPQLIISVYGLDTFGNDVVRGYGVCHLPIVIGESSEKLVFLISVSLF